RPGISGYAQVVLRNAGTWDERIELDLEYVQKMSFSFDLYIFLKTINTVVRKKNIYLPDEVKKNVQKKIGA
ncbi:MAG: sugar transferase, partial [Clostridiales bacterium]|nr:sugar transferase [Clostridiales bacterium]